MPYCRMCGKPMKDEFVYCPYCGHKNDASITTNDLRRPQTSPKVSQKITRLTVIFLILFFPVGLSMMWYYKPFTKVIRALITLLFLSVLMLVVIKVYFDIILGRFTDLDIYDILEGL
jgi:uncharacterized membrane protein YvbJ